MQTALPWICISFIAGIVLAAQSLISVTGMVVMVVAAALGSISVVLLKKRATVPLLFFFLSLGMLSHQAALQEVHGPVQAMIGKDVELTGFVQEVERRDVEALIFVLRVREAVGDQVGTAGGALVRISVYQPPPELSLAYGTRLRLFGTPKLPQAERNPGGFNYAAYLETAGVGAVMSVRPKELEILPGQEGFFLYRAVHRLRVKAEAAIDRFLPTTEAGLARGILLGDRRNVAPETLTAYRALGIAHLLAVSGLHVGFVVAFALLISSWLLRGRQTFWASVLACGFVLGYVLLTGGQPPVWRAALMFMLVLTARRAGRESEGLQSLAAAALLILFFQPLWLFSMSFQFSFLATTGLLLLTPRLQPFLRRLPDPIIGPLAVTLAAQLAVMPLQSYHFGTFSLLSVPVNLICIPVVGVAMMVGMAGVLAGMIFLPLAAPFLYAALPAFLYLEQVPQVLASLPFASWQVYKLHPAFWLLYGLALTLFALQVRLMPLTGKKVIITLTVVNIVLFGSLPAAGRGELVVTFLDVGQGLAVFIRTPSGSNLLIDAGGGGRADPGATIVLPYLRRQRVGALDALILTHPHADHYGGMPTIVRSFPVRAFISNGEEEDTEQYRELVQVLQAADVSLYTVEAGSRIVLDDQVMLEIFSPPAKRFRYTGDDVNNNSLVIRLVFQDFALLLTGDAESHAIDWLTGEYDNKLRSVVLQVPHHGSRGALSTPFLAGLQAQAAVIPVGKNNFGHPHPTTVSLLQQHGIHVYRTDLHGAVTVRSDGKDWRIDPLIAAPAMAVK